jgi:F0F1-type ATP synthase membrane subunit b/b'
MEKLFWPAVNLFMLLGFLGYKTKTPFFSYLRGRREEIFEGLNKSKSRLEEAKKRRADAEARIYRLGDESAAIAAEWSQKGFLQAEALRTGSIRVIAQMKLEAEQNRKTLMEQTKKSIQSSFRKTLLQAAEQKIVQSLNSAVHAKVNERLAGEVTRGMNL